MISLSVPSYPQISIMISFATALIFFLYFSSFQDIRYPGHWGGAQCLDQTLLGLWEGESLCQHSLDTNLQEDTRMHALAGKSLSKDRDLTPRYYYKLSEKVSCLERIKNVIRLFFTFLFTQVHIMINNRLCPSALLRNTFWLLKEPKKCRCCA